MKISPIILFLFSLCSFIHAQGIQPVDWKVEKLSETDKEVEVAFTAEIMKGWVIYSPDTEEGGPIPTHFTFDPNADIQLLGNVVTKTNVDHAFDNMFEMKVGKMKDQAVFVQKIKKNKAATALTGVITFMCCDNDKCLPPKDVEFSIEL